MNNTSSRFVIRTVFRIIITAEPTPRSNLLGASTAGNMSTMTNAWLLEFCRHAHVATLECY